MTLSYPAVHVTMVNFVVLIFGFLLNTALVSDLNHQNVVLSLVLANIAILISTLYRCIHTINSMTAMKHSQTEVLNRAGDWPIKTIFGTGVYLFVSMLCVIFLLVGWHKIAAGTNFLEQKHVIFTVFLTANTYLVTLLYALICNQFDLEIESSALVDKIIRAQQQ